MTMVSYQWAPNRSLKISAQVIGEELERIRVVNGGTLEASAVVENARDQDSILHNCGAFTWDASQAHEKHLLWEARRLIGSVVIRIVDGKETEPVRAFVNIIGDEGRTYHGLIAVMGDEEKKARLLRQARNEIEQWRRRYSALQEFANIFSAIDLLDAAE